MKRLRITGLDISDLLNHEETRLDFKIGVLQTFLGEEGVGKSAILNAVELGLTGRARGFGEKEKTLCWERLTRRGQRGARIGITFLAGDQELAVRRTKTGCTPSQEAICAALEIPDAETLHDLLKVGSFGRLKMDRRMRLIQRTLGGELTKATLDQAGVTDLEIQSRVLNTGNLRSGEAAANEKRLACQRAAKSLRTAPFPMDEELELPSGKRRLSEVPAPAMASGIDGLQKKRDDLFGAIQRAEGAASVSGGALEAAVKAAEAALASAEREAKDAAAALAALRTGERAKGYKAQKAELEALRGTAATLEQGGVDEEVKKSAAERRVATADKALAQKVGATCSLCGQAVRAEAFKAHWQAEKEAAQKDAAAADAEMATLSQSLDDLMEKVNGIRTQITAFESDGKAAVQREEAAKKAVAVATANVATARQMAEKASESGGSADLEPQRAELAGLDSRLAAARENYRRVVAYVAAKDLYDRQEAAAKEEDAKAERFGEMEKALSAEGIVAALVREPLSRLNVRIGEIAAIAFRGERRVYLSDECVIVLDDAPVEDGACASTGERFLAEFTVAAALASLTGLGFLMVDDMSHVSAAGRDRVVSAIWSIAQAAGIGQVIAVGGLRGRDGWCDGCGALRVAGPDGLCREAREDGTACGTKIVIPRPSGAAIGFARYFEVVAGKVTEILPATVASA